MTAEQELAIIRRRAQFNEQVNRARKPLDIACTKLVRMRYELGLLTPGDYENIAVLEDMMNELMDTLLEYLNPNWQTDYVPDQKTR